MRSLSFRLIFLAAIFIVITGLNSITSANQKIVYHISDPAIEHIRFFWKDDNNKPLLSLANLKSWAEKKHGTLIMAMNGGMYQQDHSPLGLYIENGNTIHRLNESSGYGNFYLKPNGVFYITKDRKGFVCKTDAFKLNQQIEFATQSGPMLLVDGKIHPEFRMGSKNLNIRNGVGILPDGKVLFAISTEPINLFDFATYFLDMGCKDALYLDGSVSRIYMPSKNQMDLEGDFGVMIGITTK